ncbi:MAG TPA: 30S ribosomal protein S6 [Terriglobales bacterium]|nr:30S ribosomal protein S6 [Terriglobales bacterium]
MQRIYEVMFIIRPDMADEDVDKLVATLESNAKAAGAEVKNTEKMGKRRLAYLVRGFNDGMYVLMTLVTDGKAIHEVERRLRVSEPVIKFITVRVDESQKRVDKLAKLRAGKVKRSTVEAAAAAQAQMQAQAQAQATPAETAPETPAGA